MLLHKKFAQSYFKRKASTVTFDIPSVPVLTDNQKKIAKVYFGLVSLSWVMKTYDDGKEKVLKTIEENKYPSIWQEWKAAHDGCGEKPTMNLLTSLIFPFHCITHAVSKIVYTCNAKHGSIGQFA